MTSPEFYEREYNARAAVPDHARYFTHWAADSATAREHLKGALDLAYGETDAERLDLFPAAESRGLLVFIHGGYWRSFDKKDFSWIAPPLVAHGVSVAMLNYALCPAVTIGAIADQCRRAVAWLVRHAPRHGVNPAPMLVSGHSAGGHLAAVLFATDWAAYGVAENPIAGGISISGLFDLDPLQYTSFNQDLRLDPSSAQAASPIFLKPTTTARLVLGVGELESSEFHRQSMMLMHAWPRCCPEVTVLEGCHHFSALDRLTDLRGVLWNGLEAGPWQT